MARLIDSNDVYSLFDVNGFARLHVSDIDTIPRVDAVEVVRCRECKHRDGIPGQPNIVCLQMHDDDFCSYGERKDGGSNG